MVEPILHFILPIVILLAFKPKVDKKLVFGLSVLTVVPDFDFIIGHRELHNLFFVLFLSLLVYFLFRFVINYDKLKKEKENKNAFYLSLYYLFFHVLLDIGRPGIPLFYPFSENLYGFSFDLVSRSFGVGGISWIEAKAVVLNQSLIEATKAQDIWIITTLGVILLVVCILFIVIGFADRKRQ